MAAGTLLMEQANGYVEISYSQRDADYRANGQMTFTAGIADSFAIFNPNLHRICKNIDRIKSDLLRLADPFFGIDGRTEPCGIDQTKLHCLLQPPQSSIF